MSRLDELQTVLENIQERLTKSDANQPETVVSTEDLIKALADRNMHPSALLLKNWNEHDENALMVQEELMKSNYGPKGFGAYDETNNIKRKAGNTGERNEDIGSNANSKIYTTSGSSTQDANEKAQQKVQNKKAKASVKVFSPDEVAALNAERNKT